MTDNMKSILFICTGNTCRSQMAEGLARRLGWKAFSAGVEPSEKANPYAVKVMAEIGVDISENKSKGVQRFLAKDLDVIVTLCDHANEVCPDFTGRCQEKIHQGFTDPFGAKGTDEEITDVYRRTRNDIQNWLKTLSEKYLAV